MTSDIKLNYDVKFVNSWSGIAKFDLSEIRAKQIWLVCNGLVHMCCVKNLFKLA